MKHWILAGVLALQGCATGYRATYTAAAVTKEFLTQEHAVYSAELNARFDECDPTISPHSGVELGNLDSLNECMSFCHASSLSLSRDAILGFSFRRSRLSPPSSSRSYS